MWCQKYKRNVQFLRSLANGQVRIGNDKLGVSAAYYGYKLTCQKIKARKKPAFQEAACWTPRMYSSSSIRVDTVTRKLSRRAHELTESHNNELYTDKNVNETPTYGYSIV